MSDRLTDEQIENMEWRADRDLPVLLSARDVRLLVAEVRASRAAPQTRDPLEEALRKILAACHALRPENSDGFRAATLIDIQTIVENALSLPRDAGKGADRA